MASILERGRELYRTGADWLVARCARLPRHTLAWASIALALILLLSVNLFASSTLRNAKADLTQQRLFTISSGTRGILRAIDEPISVRLYYSRRLGEAAPVYGRYFERVRALLQQYSDISGGRLQVEVFDPEPFSDAEDKAVAAGLRGVRLNTDGETGYFGLIATNSTDTDASIPFFSTDREPFLEYDLTKLIYSLANPKKRIVGLITGLPLDGAMNPMAMMGGGRQQPPQVVMEQIREFFEIRALDAGPEGDPRRHRCADGGATRPADGGRGLRHRSVRARRRQGAGVRRSRRRDQRARTHGHDGRRRAVAGVRSSCSSRGGSSSIRPRLPATSPMRAACSSAAECAQS